jgi:glycosyltransferase involved in cell wall biosynthesis
LPGAGHFTDDYVARCRSKAGANVRFLGAVYGQDLASLWQHAALVVLPSSMEGLSIALLEAMSFGRPVLASDIPENEEVLEGIGATFRSGDAESLGSAMRVLLESPTLREERGAQGRSRIAERYGWDRVVRETVTIYQSLLNPRL